MTTHHLALRDDHRVPAAGTADEVGQHTLPTSLALHILPGAAMLAFVALVAPLLRSRGLPPIFAGKLSILIVLVPLELGALLYLGRRRGGRLSLRGVVPYRDPVPLWQYLVLAPAMIIWYLFVMSTWRDVVTALGGLSWLPGWLLDPAPLGSSTPPGSGVQIALLVVSLILTGLVAPVVEEIYFRGYLLPRIERLGWLAPLLSAVLFAVYHLWALPAAPGRALGFLPIAIFAWRRRNITLGILVHCALNLLAVVASGGG